MTDITKCTGHNCPVKLKCYRFTAPSSEYQSYFSEPPISVEDGKLKCDHYWGDNDPFEQLNNLIANKEHNEKEKH